MIDLRCPTLFMTALLTVLVLASAARADDFADIRDTIDTCNGCHGDNGASKDDAFPIIAGQEYFYLYTQLKDFQRGSRKNEIMTDVLTDLERSVLKKLAKFYSQQKWPSSSYTASDEAKKVGQTVSAAGQCPACHLGSYTGASAVPRLAGQHASYLEKTMLEMKTKDRNNAPAMSTLMGSYSEDQIAAMAEYLGGL